MTGNDNASINLPPGANNQNKQNYLDALTNLAKEEGISGLFAGAAPRVGKAILSGAIQFATYEETKQSIAKILQR